MSPTSSPGTACGHQPGRWEASRHVGLTRSSRHACTRVSVPHGSSRACAVRGVPSVPSHPVCAGLRVHLRRSTSRITSSGTSFFRNPRVDIRLPHSSAAPILLAPVPLLMAAAPWLGRSEVRTPTLARAGLKGGPALAVILQINTISNCSHALLSREVSSNHVVGASCTVAPPRVVAGTLDISNQDCSH